MSADTEHGARFTLDAALRNPPGGLVAFGLGGPEDGVRRADFAPYFATARAAGLHSAPHAGKSVAPSEIEAAIDRLGVERIGHGIAAATDDPPMFNATLPDEYHRVRDELGCSDETLRQMARRSIEASFAPPELKAGCLSARPGGGLRSGSGKRASKTTVVAVRRRASGTADLAVSVGALRTA